MGTDADHDDPLVTVVAPASFDVVYEQQRPAIVRLAYLLVRSEAVAEELAQDAFLRLYQQFDVVKHPPGFLRTAVVRLASTWRTRHQMETERLRVVGPAPHGQAPTFDDTWDAIGHLRPERDGTIRPACCPIRPVTAHPRRHRSGRRGSSSGRGLRGHHRPWRGRAAGRVRVAGSTSTPASTRPTPAERSVPAEPISALLPTDVPAGLRPWNISVRRATTLPGFDQHVQLVQKGDGPGCILLSYANASPASKGGGSPIEVRGQAGTIMAAKESPSSTSSITWYEDGVIVDASFHDLHRTEVIDVLNGLSWKSGDHLAGFAVPAAGPISLLGEAADVSGASATPVTQAEVVYRDAATSISPGEGRQLTVRTTTATGAATVDYLRAWFQGGRPSDGQVRSFDDGLGTLRVAFSDGRTLLDRRQRNPDQPG